VDQTTSIDTIRAAATALADAARTAPDAAVPSCPGWTISTVLEHLGRVQMWASGVLRDYPTERPPFPPSPGDLTGDGLVAWASAQSDALVAAVAASDGDREVWAFGAMRPARFWWRRQAIEAAMHAWDAADAAGRVFPIPAPVGVEGVDEFLDWLLARLFAAKPPTWGSGRTIHLHRTDGEGEWLLTIADPPQVALGHAKGDLAVRGTATDLLLWVANRRADVTLFGDDGLAGAWAANVRF